MHRDPSLPVTRKWKALLGAIAMASSTGPAHAQEIPAGGALIMSDWILGAFLVFFASGLIVFITAVRLGAFRDMESAKYHLLDVEEEDYYTPEWAKEND